MADHDGMTNSNNKPSMGPIDWKDWLMRAGIVGGVASAASIALFPTVDVDVGGVRVPSWSVVGLGAAGGALAASAAHQWVFPLVPHDMRYDAAETAAVSIGASGAGSYIAGSMFGNASPLLAAVGAASFVAGDYAHSKIAM